MDIRSSRALPVALAFVAALAGCHPSDIPGKGADGNGANQPADVPASAAKYDDSSNGKDWPGFGRTYGEQHFSPLDQINTGNVQKLGLAWSFDLPMGNSISAPVEVDGVLYVATGYSVVRAIDVATGKQLWEFDPKSPQVAGARMRNGWGIRGLSWWNGKLYVGTQDGRLIAIDAKTGQQKWSVQTLQSGSVGYITGAPRAFAGKIIIGFGGADVGATRGYVSTYDAETGALLWRFYTVPGDPAKGPDGAASDEVMAKAAKTWSGQWWKYGGGGTAWNAFTYDSETDTIFVGTGNGAPWNKKVRSPGQSDDLFLCSILALDAKTGKYKWHYQVNPGETWDYNSVMDMPLATLTINGRPRKVIMEAPKNGFFYVIDRITGKLISAEPYAKVSWASKIDLQTGRPIEDPSARYPNDQTYTLWPSPAGAHNWLPMAFSPKAGLVYIPTLEHPATYSDKGIDLKTWHWKPGGINDDAVNLGFAGSGANESHAYLQAWNPVTQKQVWKVPTFGLWSGGTVASAGGLVFQGQADGKFVAYDGGNGKKLWSFDAQDAVLAPPITYEANGKQYVTVLTGFGLSFGLLDADPKKTSWQARTQQRRVLTFVLDGKSKLPAAAAPEKLTPPADPGFKPDATQIAAGNLTYHRNCVGCHGVNAVAGGAAPDLRTSAVPQSADAFNAIVRDGALVESGMPRFEQLTDAERDSIRAFLRSRARALAAGK